MTPDDGAQVPVHLLFVCTGNICRSPTAERLVRAYAAEQTLPWLTASSAGTRAVVGSAMDPCSEAVLRALGGDGTGFRARSLTAVDVAAAQLVLTMTTRHRNLVLEQNPKALRRTFTLLEAARLLSGATGAGPLATRLVAARSHHGVGDDDVADPYRGGVQAHREAGGVITRALLPLLEAIRTDSDSDTRA